MDLLIRELDQLRLCCVEPLKSDTRDLKLQSVFELAGFFRWLNREGDFVRVLEGLGWLLKHARSVALRSQLDSILDAVLGECSDEQAWQMACLFATGNRYQKVWSWGQLLDEQRACLCLQQALGHAEAEAYLHFYRARRLPGQLDPTIYHWLPLVIEATRTALPYQPIRMLRLLERLVRCGSLPAWEMLKQQSLRYGQKPVVERWQSSMGGDPFPFIVDGKVMNNRTQLLRWALGSTAEKLAGCYSDLDRRQWLVLVQLLDTHSRHVVAETTWQLYGPQTRL